MKRRFFILVMMFGLMLCLSNMAVFAQDDEEEVAGERSAKVVKEVEDVKADKAPEPLPFPLNAVAKFWYYFQLNGTISVLCWLSALVLVLIFRRQSVWRTRSYHLALLLALFGFIFSRINSESISNIRVDEKAALEERELEHARKLNDLADKEKQEKIKNEETFGLYAESDSEDIMDTAGKDKDGNVIEEDDEDEDEGDKEYEDAINGNLQRELLAERKPGEEGAPIDQAAVDAKIKAKGKQKRKGGKTEKLEEVTAVKKEQIRLEGRMMLQADMEMAEKLDRINLRVAKWGLMGMILLYLWNYLTFFNRTFRSLFPLPLGGPWIDALFKKDFKVLAIAQNIDSMAKCLKSMVRKGESFIYFGPEDPLPQSRVARIYLNLGKYPNMFIEMIADWLFDIDLGKGKGKRKVEYLGVPQANKLYRRGLDKLADPYPRTAKIIDIWRITCYRSMKRVVSRMPYVLLFIIIAAIPLPFFFNTYEPGFYYYIIIMLCIILPMLFLDTPLLDPFIKKISYDHETQPTDPNFVFESAWFGRNCFTVCDLDLANQMLVDLNNFLNARNVPRAKSLRSINILWDFEELPDAEQINELAGLARESNMRIILFCAGENFQEESMGIYDQTFAMQI